jgi:excisionase family DNA binding protein
MAYDFGLQRPLFDTAAAAHRLSLSEGGVRRHVYNRTIPFIKVAKYVRFDQSDLDVWLALQRVDPEGWKRFAPQAPKPQKDRPLLDTFGVAERLAVPERLSRRLVFERRIPFLKLGKYIRFDQNDLDLWVDDHRVEVGQTIERGLGGLER